MKEALLEEGDNQSPVVLRAAPVGAPSMGLGQPATIAAQPVYAQATTGGNIVYAQPQQLVYAQNQAPIPGQWRDGVCGCFSDCNSLLLAWCCPCFSYANSVSQTKLGNYQMSLIKYMLFVMAIGFTQQLIRGHETCVEAEDDDLSDNHYTPEDCTLDGFGSAMSLIGTFASAMLFLSVMKLRTNFRRTFGINGSCCDDCCSSFFCQCCVLAQMDRHLTTSVTKGGCVLSDPGPSPLLNNIGQPQQAVLAQPYVVAQPGQAQMAQPNMVPAQHVVVAQAMPQGTVTSQHATMAQAI
jgi:Cys-rich protein (TIGR01571 family)